MIPQQLLEEMSTQINQLSQQTQKLARAELEAIEYSSVAEMREKTLEVLNKYTNASVEMASAYGANFFQSAMAENGEETSAAMYSFSNDDANEQAVRGMIQDVAASGSVSAFFDKVQNRLDYNIRKASNESVLENVKDRSKHLKFARVPVGRETCVFCFMLASRGFVYWSKATAGLYDHYHSHCDCRIVPGYADMNPDDQIEGYKPTEMARRYEDCYNAVKSPDGGFDYDLFKKDVANGKYADNSQDWERWKLNRLMKEMKSRDTDWLWEKKTQRYEIMEGASPKEHEKGTADRLGSIGIKTIFKPTKDKNEEKSADVYDVTNGKKKSLEFKSPTGGGKQTIYHQLEEAAGQSRNLVIDISRSKLEKEQAYSAIKRVADWNFKIRTGKEKGTLWKFKEIRLVCNDGKSYIFRN